MSSSHCRTTQRALTGGQTRWQRALVERVSIVGCVAFAALMAGCGGGGGSDDPVVAQTPARTITANNAEPALKLTLEMMDLADALTTSWGLGSGLNETRCESGSGIGTVSNCVIGTNTFNGAVTATISESKTVIVPGDTRSRVVPVSMALAISNLQWQSSNNSATYTINGNLSVTYNYPIYSASLGTATVTGTLTLTDAATGTRYQYRNLTQRYSLTVNDTVHDYEFAHSDHEGSVVYMDEDRKYSLISGSLFDYLALVGNGSKLSLADFNGSYIIKIDTNNDGDYDTFTTMPASELGKGHTTSNSALSASVSRQGGNSTPVEKRRAVTLTAGVTDANYNFHTFSWAITSAPPEATGDNEAVIAATSQTTGSQSFTGYVAGDYTVTVTATEAGVSSAPASATAEIILRVGLEAPELDVTSLRGAVGAVNSPVSFPITEQNLEGTVTPPTLLSAPAGMTLTGNRTDGYQLQWDPQPQLFPGTSETVTLQVSNEDRDTINSYTVTVSDPVAQAPLVTAGISINDFPTGASILNVDSDVTDELLMAGNSSAFFGLNLSGGTPSTAIANPYALETGNLLAIRPLHTNGVISAYAVAGSRGVSVVDATTFAIRATRGLQFNVTPATSKRRFAVADVNVDGTDEIIALTKTAGSTIEDQLFVLNQDLTTRASTDVRALGQQFLVGNVDADSDLEIVCGNGLILNANGLTTLATEFEAGVRAGNKNYVLANVDADSQQEIIEVDNAGEIAVVDVDTAARTAITLGLNAVNLNLFALNADGDANDELLIGGANNLVYVYSIDKTAPSATLDRTLGNASAGNEVTEVVRGNVTGDSAEELVFVSSNGSGGALINVTALNGNVLIDGASQALATGSFAAARVQNHAAESGFFTATVMNNGVAGKGVVSVDGSNEPSFVLLDVATDTGLFAASADIDGNNEADLLASTQLSTDTDMSVLALLTGVSAWQLPIVAGTPAPVATGQIGGSGIVDAVYIERTGAPGNEAVSLVVHEVNGGELGRFTLQSSGTLAAVPVAVAVANLDGDANPDIVLLEETGLRAFEYAGGNLQQTASIAIDASARALAIGDRDNDGMDEIAITRSGTSSAIQVYDGTLALVVETSIAPPTAALSFYAAANARPLWLFGTGSNVVALDAQSLVQLWSSPSLHGQVNSVDVLTTSNGDQLRVGSENAIYRSQP